MSSFAHLKVLLLSAWAGVFACQAAPVLGPWTPIFKGIEHSVSTNLPTPPTYPNRHVVHALRVDLTQAELRFMATPRYVNYTPRDNETGGRTVSDFLKVNNLQVAINANFFNNSAGYYAPANTPMDVYGLQVSEGVAVSTQDNKSFAESVLITKSNRVSIVHTNFPANLTDVWNAISGDRPLVVNGTNYPAFYSNSALYDRNAEPRTAVGLSKDGRYLFLVTIDGRQGSYSAGSADYETAGWMILFGAYDAVNMDGGGSTTMVMADSTGKAVRLNKSSAVADSGKERTIASHLGISAKPLPGFINDVTAAPDTTSATITWTTLDPSTTQVKYGTTTNLNLATPLLTNAVPSHRVELTGLIRKTDYFFQVLSSKGAESFASPIFTFMTSNYVTTNLLFDFSHEWKFAPNLGGTAWKETTYDDSSWGGPGPALLWIDTGAVGPNPDVNPRMTEIPADPSTASPYVAYYFRTHFNADVAADTSFSFSGYIDDGAIFYLNGVEIYRLRMPTGTVDSTTLAPGFPCEGSATCLDEFEVPATALSSLRVGDNVLAVEVHNFSVRSPDITFGVILNQEVPENRSFKLSIGAAASGGTVLSWSSSGLTLQTATALSGPWSDVSSAQSPFNVTATERQVFYRLRR